jgi:hypothetical protein
MPGQWVQSAGPLPVMSCRMPRQCSISSVKGDSPPLPGVMGDHAYRWGVVREIVGGHPGHLAIQHMV